MRRRKRIIVGIQVVVGVLCVRCPGHAYIYPPTALPEHMAKHEANGNQHARYRGGRTPNSVNYHQMSATGVEHKKGIRLAK